ncbi:MAG: ABC transporter ATP-binding protein [Streptosporangiaceae bacterium]
MNLLEVRGLTVGYGAEPVVRDVSLDIAPGQVLGLAGESGSGKSTVGLSVLRLLPRPANVTGAIVFRGEDLTEVNWGRIRAIRWAGASIVFQGALNALNPVKTIGAQLAEPVRVHGSGQGVAELLESVGVPAARARCYPHELSGGQRQRTLIAMALACRPDLIIADEPTTALDTIIQAQILSLLTSVVRDSGAGMLMISHDLAVLSEVCDDLAVMCDGAIVETGSADAVLLDPAHDYTRTLTAAFPRLGDPAARLAPPTARREPLLAARDLRVSFGQSRAVDGVNLTIGEREIVTLIGESGCGKSTLARALTGLIRPDAGSVSYRDEPLRYGSAALKRHRRHVQLISQDPGGALNPRRTVFDAVAEGPRVHGMRQGLTRRVYTALHRAGLNPPERFVSRYPRELSGGQQQRVVIAGALALDPEVIVADEPVSALDAPVRERVLRLISDLRDTFGLSALIVSHDLGLAWTIADRVAVMYLGRIVESGPAEEVLQYPRHPYTRALLAAIPGSGTHIAQGLRGEPPDPGSIPPGCRFHPRCPRREPICETVPLPILIGDGVACHLADNPPEETFLS